MCFCHFILKQLLTLIEHKKFVDRGYIVSLACLYADTIIPCLHFGLYGAGTPLGQKRSSKLQKSVKDASFGS